MRLVDAAWWVLMAFSQLLHCVLMPTPLLRRSRDEERPLAPGKHSPEHSNIRGYWTWAASSLHLHFEPSSNFFTFSGICPTAFHHLHWKHSRPLANLPILDAPRPSFWQSPCPDASGARPHFPKHIGRSKKIDHPTNPGLPLTFTSDDAGCYLTIHILETFTSQGFHHISFSIHLVPSRKPSKPQRPVTISKIHAAHPGHFELPVGRFEHPVRVTMLVRCWGMSSMGAPKSLQACDILCRLYKKSTS